MDSRSFARLQLILRMLKDSVPLDYCALLCPSRDLYIYTPETPHEYEQPIHADLPQIAALADDVFTLAVRHADEIIVRYTANDKLTYVSIKLVDQGAYVLCVYRKLGSLVYPWRWYPQAIIHLQMLLSRME